MHHLSDPNCEGRPQVPEPDNGRPDGKKRNSKENFSAFNIHSLLNFKNNKFVVFRFLNTQRES